MNDRHCTHLISIIIFTFLEILILTSSLEAAITTDKNLEFVLLPTVNSTEMEVWESRYYPVDVLTSRITEEFESILKEYPYAHVRRLSAGEEKKWLNGYGTGNIGIKLELYRNTSRERQILGRDIRRSVSLRMTVYDGRTRQVSFAESREGRSRRYIFNPGDGRIFFLSLAGNFPFENIFRDNIDFWRLFPDKDDEQPFSRPLWKSFRHTACWNALKVALKKCRKTLTEGTVEYHHVGQVIGEEEGESSSRALVIDGGRRDGLSEQRHLYVIRSHDIRTLANAGKKSASITDIAGELHVNHVDDHTSTVSVLKEDKAAPIIPGDIVVMKLYEK